MLADDWDTCVAMAREAVKGGAHVLDVCVDYTGEDGVADMQRGGQPLRHPGHPADHARLDRAAGDRGRAAAHRRQAHPQLGQPRGRRRPGHPPGPLPVAGPGVRRRGGVHLHRHRGPGPHRRVEAAGGPGHPRPGRRPLRPGPRGPALRPAGPAASAPAWRRAAGTASRPSRASGRIKAELPGVGTILGLSNVSFGLTPAARHALNSVFLHECQQAGLDAAIVHAARIMPLHKIDPRVVEVCLDLIYDRRDPATGYDPLAELLAPVRGGVVRRRWSPRTAAAGRSSAGSSSASSTATATGSKPTWTRPSATGGPPSTSSTARCSAA